MGGWSPGRSPESKRGNGKHRLKVWVVYASGGIHRSKSKKQRPFKNQRNIKYYKQILGVGFVKEMFEESRLLAGILRSKVAKLSPFKNQRGVRYYKQNLGAVARGYEESKCKLRVGWQWPLIQSSLQDTKCGCYVFLQDMLSICQPVLLVHSGLGLVWQSI